MIPHCSTYQPGRPGGPRLVPCGPALYVLFPAHSVIPLHAPPGIPYGLLRVKRAENPDTGRLPEFGRQVEALRFQRKAEGHNHGMLR